MSFLNFRSSFDTSKKVCRSCLSNTEDGEMQDIFETGFVEAFSYCTALQASPSDGLPPTLCRECVDLINTFYFFKQQCSRSDEILRGLPTLSEVPPTVKEEPDKLNNSFDDDDDDDDDNDNVNFDSVHESEDQDIPTTSDKTQEVTSGENFIPRRTRIQPQEVIELREKIMKDVTLRDDGKFVCNICGKDFQMKPSIITHIKIHMGIIKITCDICGKSCTTTANLKNHMRTHNPEKPFKCELCDKHFKHEFSAVLHKKRHNDDDKDFMCSICGKLAVNINELRIHMRYHSTEKPHQCPFCPKSFKTRSSLSLHKVFHSDKRPYSCNVCTKSFKTRTACKKHNLIHIGIKEFVCHICQRAFLVKNKLTRHMKSHENSF